MNLTLKLVAWNLIILILFQQIKRKTNNLIGIDLSNRQKIYTYPTVDE